MAPHLKAGFEALLGRCQRNRLSPEDHLDVDQVASSYSSARGLPSLRPTLAICLHRHIYEYTQTVIDLGTAAQSLLEESACQRITARRYINISPPRLFHSTTRHETKQHCEDNGYSTCIIPQHISHTSASGHHGLRHNTTRPA
jgi:hypothetical protein